MRHFKYLPAATMVVLLVLWMVSIWAWVDCSLPVGGCTLEIGVCEGNLQPMWASSPSQGVHLYYFPTGNRSLFDLQNLGHLQWVQYEHSGTKYGYCGIPLVLMLTAVVPFLIGSLTRYKFRLWYWFVYIAIIAILLAYFVHQPLE